MSYHVENMTGWYGDNHNTKSQWLNGFNINNKMRNKKTKTKI